MRPFNLAESKMLERKYCRQFVHKRLRCVAVMGVLIVFAGIGSSVARQHFRHRHDLLKKDLAGMQSISRRSQRDIESAEKLSLRHTWQQQLVGGTKQCVGNISAVLMCTPTDIWLQKVESMDRDARIAIAGMSTSYTALSVFTNNLRRSSVFSDVRIAGAKAAGGRSSEAVAFSVEVKVPSGVGAASSSDAAPAAPSVPKIPGAM